MTTTHKEVKNLLGVYAVNALDADERRHVEIHLPTCEECTQELSEHLETLAALTEDAQDLPSTIWGNIQGSLEEAPPARVVVPKTWRWNPSRFGMALAAAASIVFVVMGVRLVQQEGRLDTLTAAIQRQSIEDVAESAAARPDATLLSLQSPDKSMFARLVILPDGTGYVTADNLGSLTSDKSYQLWALRGEEKISLGVLGSDPNVSAFRTVPGAAGFAITVERAGGVEVTKANPLVFGFLES
ncbi:MAG TPA: anti-sigma factor [Actinomycetota bacterium]|nr:anti-sigma factor [Actinomycetota bacterium]